MPIRRILTIALFMIVAFLGFKGMGTPEWATVLVSVAVGEFLWSRERIRAERQVMHDRLQQLRAHDALMLELKLDKLMLKLETLGGDSNEDREHAPQAKVLPDSGLERPQRGEATEFLWRAI